MGAGKPAKLAARGLWGELDAWPGLIPFDHASDPNDGPTMAGEDFRGRDAHRGRMEQAADLRAQANGVAVVINVTQVKRQLDGRMMPVGNMKKIKTLAVRHTAQIYFESFLLHSPQHAAFTQELRHVVVGVGCRSRLHQVLR